MACNSNNDYVDSPLRSEETPKAKAPGVIPKDVGLSEIITLPTQHTWRDLDEYYRDKLPEFYREDYYDNLRESVLFHLVFPFRFQEQADKETIEYYFGEMQQVGLMDPDAFLTVAARMFLNGWTKEQVRAAAKERYDKNLEVFASLNNPQQALDKYGAKHDKLQRFAANFPNRWGSY